MGWGGLTAGIFGFENFGGMGGVGFMAQLAGTLSAIIFATISGFIVYGVLKSKIGIRLEHE